MTHQYDYMVANQLLRGDPPFDALIMAALLKADSVNWAKLNILWPDISQYLDDVKTTPVWDSDPHRECYTLGHCVVHPEGHVAATDD